MVGTESISFFRVDISCIVETYQCTAQGEECIEIAGTRTSNGTEYVGMGTGKDCEMAATNAYQMTEKKRQTIISETCDN